MIILVSSLINLLDEMPLSENKKVAFIPNGRDKHDSNRDPPLEKDRAFLREKGYSVTDINLKEYQGDQLYKKLSEFEMIYVTGGNTFYLLEIIRKSGFDKILPKLLKKGVIYIGKSAGACVMGSSIEPMRVMDNPKKATLENYNGLRYFDFVFVPHSESKKFGELAKEIERKFSKKYKLKKFTDYEGVIIDNSKKTIKYIKAS